MSWETEPYLQFQTRSQCWIMASFHRLMRTLCAWSPTHVCAHIPFILVHAVPVQPWTSSIHTLTYFRQRWTDNNRPYLYVPSGSQQLRVTVRSVVTFWGWRRRLYKVVFEFLIQNFFFFYWKCVAMKVSDILEEILRLFSFLSWCLS